MQSSCPSTQAYAIIEDEQLWTDLEILTATVNVSVVRVSSFDIFRYWNMPHILFVEESIAAHLPSYWESRTGIWVVSLQSGNKTDSIRSSKLTNNALCQADYIQLPHGIASFVQTYARDTPDSRRSTDKRMDVHTIPVSRQHGTIALGRVITVMSAHGGAGASSLGMVLGHLHQSHSPVVYIDLTGRPECCVLGVHSVPVISDLYRDVTSVKEQLLSVYPVSHYGFRVASGAPFCEDMEQLIFFIDALKNVGITVIFDCGRLCHSTEQMICAAHSDHVLLVTRGTPRGAWNIASCVERFSSEIKVVVIGKFSYGLTHRKFVSLSAQPIFHQLPYDTQFHMHQECGKNTIPGRYYKHVQALAKELCA